jgi:hypothetical protein
MERDGNTGRNTVAVRLNGLEERRGKGMANKIKESTHGHASPFGWNKQPAAVDTGWIHERMPKLLRIKILVIVGFGLIAGQVVTGNPNDPDSSNAVESEITYGAETDFNNKYLWRGITYDDGFVIQPDVWVSYQNITFGVWSNIAMHDIHHSKNLNEIDLSLSYEYSLLKCDFENSLMYYNYQNQPDSPPTGEFYFGIGYSVGEFKCLSNFTIDVVEYPGAFFVEHGLEYEKQLTEEFSLASSLNLGWASRKFNETYAGVSKTTMNMIGANISLTYYPIARLYIKPHLQLNKIIDKNLYETLNKHSSEFGLLLGVEY